MHRTFRYPLEPTRAQEAILASWLEHCRQLYNASLEHRIGARRQGVSVSRYDQQKELTELRAADVETRAVPLEVSRSALRRLDGAYQAFFRRCKAVGERPGFPRFRGRGRYDSFSIGWEGVRVERGRVRVPKLGLVKLRLYRPLRGKIRHATIRRSGGRWLVCFACDLGVAPEKIPVRRAVGIDLGLAVYAYLSDGSSEPNPRFFRAGEEQLAKRQRALMSKRRGSTSRHRAKLLVRRANEHIKNQRLDHARKLASSLFERFDLVASEDLNLRGLLVGHRAKSISDASWGVFLQALVSKAECAGKWAVPVDPRGTSQRCSGCGAVAKKKLSERRHRCECGLQLDRDENAARNVLALAAGRAVVEAGQSPN